MPRMLPSIFSRGRDLAADPFGSLRSEIDRVFEDFGRWPPLAGAFPKVDVSETQEAVEIDAELPGMSEDDIHLSVEDMSLVISGERKQEREEKGRDWRVQERSWGSFVRRVPMPFTPKPEEVKAQFKNGVLHVTVQKPPKADNATKIAIEKA